MSTLEAIRSPTEGRPRAIAGWGAVLLSTLLSSFWAVWGSIENFHEGWYHRELWRNLSLAAIQYLPWMFIPMVAGVAGLWQPAAGLVIHAGFAAGALWLFGVPSVGAALLAAPLILLAILYGYGRPVPLARARYVLVAVPLITALGAGAYPAWRVLTRPATVDTSMRRIPGNGVDLWWAPVGPGWDDRGFSWFEARRRCEHLTADGTALALSPQGLWRLPTVDEAVRTMMWRSANAGGRWDAASRQPHYRVMPDKEAPLWHPYSQVIYWWTADEVGGDRAYRVVYNGKVNAVPKRWQATYLACRCVKP